MIPIRALYCGIQPTGNPSMPSFALYTLLEPIPDHPQYSTVSLHTIQSAGYEPVEGTHP